MLALVRVELLKRGRMVFRSSSRFAVVGWRPHVEPVRSRRLASTTSSRFAAVAGLPGPRAARAASHGVQNVLVGSHGRSAPHRTCRGGSNGSAARGASMPAGARRRRSRSTTVKRVLQTLELLPSLEQSRARDGSVGSSVCGRAIPSTDGAAQRQQAASTTSLYFVFSYCYAGAVQEQPSAC